MCWGFEDGSTQLTNRKRPNAIVEKNPEKSPEIEPVTLRTETYIPITRQKNIID